MDAPLLMLPASAFLGVEFDATYRVVAWLPWIANLALFEYHIRRNRASTGPYPRFAEA